MMRKREGAERERGGGRGMLVNEVQMGKAR